MCGLSKMSRRVDIFLLENAHIEERLEAFPPRGHSAFRLGGGIITDYDFYKLMTIYTSWVTWNFCNKKSHMKL